jgi:hypothetical protein
MEKTITVHGEECIVTLQDDFTFIASYSDAEYNTKYVNGESLKEVRANLAAAIPKPEKSNAPKKQKIEIKAIHWMAVINRYDKPPSNEPITITGVHQRDGRSLLGFYDNHPKASFEPGGKYSNACLLVADAPVSELLLLKQTAEMHKQNFDATLHKYRFDPTTIPGYKKGF